MMNARLLFLFILFFPNFIHAQAKIKFDTTLYDLGMILQGSGTITKEIKFKNTGTEPLVIQRASTGDGGSFADYPKEPIPPNKTGTIRFHYDSNRIGPFNRGIYIECNAPLEKSIAVKGEVVYRPTQISVTAYDKNIGDLNFGEIDTVQFSFFNSGNNPLHVFFDHYNYPETDLMWLKIDMMDSVNEFPGRMVYNPKEKVLVKALIKNVYGNTGTFHHKLFFTYNSHDTLVLTVSGNYVGVPDRQKIVEGNGSHSSVFYYEKDKLVKKEVYDNKGRLNSEEFYSNSNCMHKKIYDENKGMLWKEFFYMDGKITEKKSYTIPY